jgi:YhcH/YjgK/YiaL family protein
MNNEQKTMNTVFSLTWQKLTRLKMGGLEDTAKGESIMIYDLIGNAKQYSKGFKQLSKAIAFIKKIDPSVKDGRYDICGDEMYAIISSYQTTRDDESLFEAHRKYIDVQYMLKGEERIDVTQGTDVRIKERYSAKKDVFFIHTPKCYSSIILSSGNFALFYPQDYHRPGKLISTSKKVRKVVIKIRG